MQDSWREIEKAKQETYSGITRDKICGSGPVFMG